MEKVFFFYIWQPCLVFHFWRFYVFPLALLTSASGFLALDSRFLFSTVGSSWHWVYVFPLFAHVSCFPRLTAASGFLALSTKFSCARQPFLVFHCWLELALSLCFPALRTRFMFPALDSSFKFSRACQQVLPRLQPFRVFPPLSLASLFLLASLAHLSIT